MTDPRRESAAEKNNNEIMQIIHVCILISCMLIQSFQIRLFSTLIMVVAIKMQIKMVVQKLMICL